MKTIEEKKAYQRLYYLVHKKKRKMYCFINSEKIKLQQKKYNKMYCLANFEKIKLRHKEYDKAYYLINKEKIKKEKKAYRQKYPEKGRIQNRKHKALKLGNNHEPYTDIYIYERDGWICQICGRKINKRLKRHHPYSKSIDHIIPLSKGGADAPINLQATHLRCNQGKYIKGGGQLRLIG